MPARFETTIGMCVANTFQTNGHFKCVQTVDGAIYVFQISDVNALVYRKSTDGGLTWSLPVTIRTGTETTFAVWYDRWSGIAAGLIHLAYTDSTPDDTFYRSIDTENSDSLSTETTIFAGTSAVAAGSGVSITRARGGYLYCWTLIDSGAEGGFFRSTDVGANWSSRTLPEAVAVNDTIVLLPGWAADNQDIMGFFWDASANEVSRYVHDDSANTWAETSIATSMVEDATASARNLGATVDLANSRNLLVAWTQSDLANADLRCWRVTESDITELTNVVQDSGDDQGYCDIGIQIDTGHWYAIYGGKSDGSETFATALKAYYKVSQDAGSTWGAETPISDRPAYAMLGAKCCPRFVGDIFSYVQRDDAPDFIEMSFAVPRHRAQLLSVGG